MKRKQNGFTLVEIIVAIGLIGIISAGFLTVISNNYRFMFETKRITEEAFQAQKDMEVAIDDTKNKIVTPGHGGLTMSSITVFENITVEYYNLTNSYNGNEFYTFVSDTRLPSIPKLNVTNVGIDKKYSNSTTKYVYSMTSSELEAEYTNDPSTIDDLMVNLYTWYVAKPGFNIPVPLGSDSGFNYLSDLPESELTGRYPIFPDDYYLISAETSEEVIDLSGYAGRPVILTVTPAAKSGKIGNSVQSLPVHINGLPEPVKAKIHFDASYIDPYNTTEVSDSSARRVIRWYDLSSGIGTSAPTEYGGSSSTSSRPLVIDTDVTRIFNSRYVSYGDTTSSFINHQNLNGKTISYFAVVRGRESSVNEKIFVNGNYTASVIEDESNKLNEEGWYLVTGSYLSNSNTVTIGSDEVDLAELVLYDQSIDVSAVSDYFKQKYLPVDSDATIVSMDDMTQEVYVGESYLLPTAVLAKMSVGPDKMVQVTWNGIVDTSTPQTVTLTGKAVDDETKTMTLTVIVKPVVLATDITLSTTSLILEKNETHDLVAVIVPDDVTDKSIMWSSSDNSIATVTSGTVTAISKGTAIVTATSGDGEVSKTCTVLVNEGYNWPSGEILHLDSSFEVDFTGSNVDKWNDISGFDNDFTSSGNDRPSRSSSKFNGFDTIEFDSSSREFLKAGKFLNGTGSNVDFHMGSGTNSGPFTMFMISKANNDSTGTFLSQSRGWGGSATYSLGVNAKSFAERVNGATNTSNVSHNSNFNLHRVTWDSSNHTYYINGSNALSSPNVGGKVNQQEFITIGATRSGTSNWLSGNVAEVLVFNRKLSSSEINVVEDYLNAKWFKTYGYDWQFGSSAEGWYTGNHISSFAQNNNVVSGNINGVDPYILSSPGLNVNANNYKRILIRMKNETSSNKAQIYFTTNSDGSFGENKVVNFAIEPNSGYKEYIIDMTESSNWTGTLRQLRIDPAVGANGSFSIDYVRIIE